MTATNNTNTIDDSLVNKIRGLLRLSTSANENEAQLAMQKARALCVKYDLDIASIAADKTKNTEEPIVKGRGLDLGQRMSICQNRVSAILMDHFNVKIIYSGSRYLGQRIIFVGRQRDIEVATYLNGFLNNEFLRLWRDYYKKNKPVVTLRERAGYIAGLARGLDIKLDSAKKETEEESFSQIKVDQGEDKMEEVKKTYALQVVGHAKKLSEKVNEFFPRLGTRTIGSGVSNYNSYNQGIERGKQININRPIGNGAGTGRLSS